MSTDFFNHCVQQHADGLFRFLCQFMDQESARDMVQDCFEKLWIKREVVDQKKVKSYLFTTAYNGMIDSKRKGSRLSYTDNPKPVETLHTNEAIDLQDILKKALETLPEIQKTLVLLRDYEGYSYDEIGEITGLSEAKVKVYIFRARVSLKNYIGKIEAVI